MKYRVRVNMAFDSQADAQVLLNNAKGLVSRGASLNLGKENEEISFCELELCRHDEGLPCTRIERIEIRGGAT